MKTKSVTYRYVPLLALCAGTAGALLPSGARSADSIGPQKCDVELSVSDALALHPPKAKRRYKVSVELVTLSGYYYQAFAYGAQKAASEAGVDVVINAGKGFSSQAEQLANVESSLARHVDGILIEPVDEKGAVAAIDAAAEKKVAVVAAGTLVDSPKAIRVVQDDYVQGVVTARALVQLLPEGGQGILMGGPANGTWAMHRVAGFQDEAKKHPSIKIDAVTHQDVNPAEGLTKFTNAVQAHPKVDWIYSTYELLLPPTSIPPNYSAAKYLTSSYDPETIKALDNGTVAMTVPVYPVWMGYIGMTNLIEKLDGGSPPAVTCLPNTVVTKEHMRDPGGAEGNLYPEGWKLPHH
jgi:ribose transport system substrate-binding protein